MTKTKNPPNHLIKRHQSIFQKNNEHENGDDNGDGDEWEQVSDVAEEKDEEVQKNKKIHLRKQRQ